MLADPRVVRESTITELAGTSASAASTVARFCQRLGFDGYRQFRAAVIAALGYDDARLGEFDLGEGEIDAGDAPEEIAAKIAFQEVRAIQATMAALDLDATARGRGARRGEADRALRRRLVVADRAGPLPEARPHRPARRRRDRRAPRTVAGRAARRRFRARRRLVSRGDPGDARRPARRPACSDRVAQAATRVRTWRIRLADREATAAVLPVAQVLGPLRVHQDAHVMVGVVTPPDAHPRGRIAAQEAQRADE